MKKRGNYLHVTIDIPTAQESRFKSLMSELLPKFTAPAPKEAGADLTFGWDLVTAMAAPAGDATRITHLWRVDPAHPWMTDVMGELGTDKAYAKLDRLVEREEQNYMHSDDHYQVAEDRSKWRHAGAIETLQVTRDPAKLADLEDGGGFTNPLGLEDLANEAQKTHGWRLLLQLTPVSGLLRQFVHFWAIEPAGTQSVAVFRNWLVKRKEYDAVLSTALIAAKPIHYAARAEASKGS